jgi:hypothetical protein
MYDYLALPPEVILELLNFCVDRSREKYGPGRLPSMRSIEKEAFVWANMEILTLEQAEEYIEACKARPGRGEGRPVLNIRGRELSPTEQKYYRRMAGPELRPGCALRRLRQHRDQHRLAEVAVHEQNSCSAGTKRACTP